MLAAFFLPLALLAGLLLLVWAGQRRMIYFPARIVPAPAQVGLSNVDTVAFRTADGITLHGWFVPSRRPPPWFTVIVCNGNAGNRAYRAPLADALRANGLSVLLFDYRGYGDNAGAPTERGLAADVRAARAYAASRPDVDRSRIVYFGESLGAAVVIELAAEYPPAALVVRSPFSSLGEVGQVHYPWLPVRWLLRDRFASIERIQQVNSPLLVIAGEHDGIVPLEHSRRLYEAAHGRKEMVVIEGADHNDEALLTGERMIAAIVRFLREIE